MRTFLLASTAVTAVVGMTAGAAAPFSAPPARGLAGPASSPIVTPVLEDRIDPNLRVQMDQAGPNDVLSALVYLDVRVDIDALEAQFAAQDTPLDDRHELVVTALRETAAATQPPVADYLAARQAAGGVASFESYWIVNAFRVDATAAELEALAARPEVHRVFLNYPIELIEPVAREDGGVIAGGPTTGLEAIRAPEVWDMGIDGDGVLVASLDTGVQGSHPALADRWAGVADPNYAGHPEWAFFDPNTNQDFPFDSGSHGTHTMGTICGGAPGEQIGVAPGALWIHAAVIDIGGLDNTVAKAIEAFQWTADPDGDPSTSWDVPDVCSNSWGLTDFHGYPDCDELFWDFLDACEAVGTVIVFAAGNEGSSGLRRPGDRATDDYRTFAVAAVDGNQQGWPVAGFSSRGPTFCGPNGEMAIKPDISAPGVSVFSSVPGGYANFDGTSMACPHIAGVVALMRQANPSLPPAELKQAIYDSAFDLGSTGEDNTYGWGMVDAFEAVNIALSLANLDLEFPNGFPSEIDPLGGGTFPVTVVEQQSEHAAGTGLLWVNDGDGWTSHPMLETGENTYDAVFPPTECPGDVNFYVSVETTDGEVVNSPFNAPDSYYTTFSISEVQFGFNDSFQQDLGWTVNGNATTGQWQRGVPVGDGLRGDPETDSDGSGRCYLTGNAPGDSDVDGGSTRLVSPLLDATGGSDAIVAYDRWYSNSINNSTQDDVFVVEISNNGGSTWTQVETVGPTGPGTDGGWVHVEFVVGDYVTPTDQIRLRFTASDTGQGSVVEAGVDAVQVKFLLCHDSNLLDATVTRGTLVSGGVTNLTGSDDSHLRSRSERGFTVQEPNVNAILVGALGDPGAGSIDVAVESRLNHANGTATLSMRNWSTGDLEPISTYAIGTSEVTEALQTDAANRVRDDGRVELEVKYVVPAVFAAVGFDSYIDLVELQTP